MYIFLGIVLGALLVGVLFLPWILLFYVIRFQKDLYYQEVCIGKISDQVRSNTREITKLLFGGDKNA